VFVGGGPLRGEIEARVRALGLEPEVRQAGRVSHQEMGLAYDQSHALLFTSLRDTSGNVVLEAMAHALPVVAMDQHGVREILDTVSGTKVAIHDRDQVVRDLAAALEQLALDPDLRLAQGNAGRRRVELVYQWDHKGELLRQLYGRLSPAPAPRPTPSGPAHPAAAR
jgi:glycosyltransferase involved in cell wall biosynthesis